MDLQKATNKLVTQAEKAIRHQYKIALDETRKKLALIYEKYSIDGKLSYADLVKYNRLTSLEKEIVDVFNDSQAGVISSLKKLPADVIKEAYSITAGELSDKVNLGLIPRKAIESAISNPLDLIAHNTLSQDMRARIRREVVQGAIQGKGYDKVASAIKQAYGVTASRAMTIARTEGQRAMNEGHREAYSKAVEKGIDVRLFWDAYIDSRTRDSHALMNGVEAEMHDGELMFFYSPLGIWVTGPQDPQLPAEDSINCRCRVRMELA
jgi:SPP1 gp7 family putative phage head morphogenesis protein